MSYVTNVILLCGLSEESGGEDVYPAIDELNKWLTDSNYQHAGLFHLNGHEGGHKAWEAEVFGGAFNYLSIDEFMKKVSAVKWEQPDCVQVLFKGQEDEVWGMVHLIDPQQSRQSSGAARVARISLGRETPDEPWE